MAILKSKKARELNEKELEEKLREFRLELSKERATSEIGGGVKNPGRIREIRRAIARIATEKSRRNNNTDNKKSTPKRNTKGVSGSGASNDKVVK